MKSKDLFNTLFNMRDGELDRDELMSIIWSNPLEEDFMGVMCALMDFVESEGNK